MKFPQRRHMSRKTMTLTVSLLTTLGGGFALSQGVGVAPAPATTGSLAKSQQEEQKLLDAIGRTQLEVQKAMKIRTAAVMKYANATGSATLLVKTQAVPKTHTTTKASGGGKNGNEFERD